MFAILLILAAPAPIPQYEQYAIYSFDVDINTDNLHLYTRNVHGELRFFYLVKTYYHVSATSGDRIKWTDLPNFLRKGYKKLKIYHVGGDNRTGEIKRIELER